ncbi:interleukin-1 receptor type 1-like isoform X2 [Brachyhypopomus gauderio]
METVVFLSVESGSCPSPNMFKVAWRGSNFNFSCAEEIPTSGQLLQVHLWKDCKSTGLEGHEISFFNMSMSDMGNYTCMVIFKYAGKNYTASLTTKIAVINGDETQKKPEVISPRDNTVHVKPGERMKLDCIVFIGTEDTRSETSMYWTINDSYTWTYPQIHENVTFERKDDNNVYGHSTLIIPEVLPEFFGVIFKCIVRNPSGEDMGVVHLRQDDDNTIQIVLIVSVLVVVVVTVLFMVFKADIILAYHDLAGTGKAANDDGKAYDAYVSCYPGHGPGSSRVEDLALRLLPEVLEQQHNIRLFIHGRDDTDDEVNLAAMTDVIGQSRTVVLILHRLSPANQENQALVPISQGRDMLNASQCEDLCSAIAQCRVPVILVEGEKNVDYSLLPECLQAVRSLSVLRWSPTARPSGRFWKQLRYRMT